MDELLYPTESYGMQMLIHAPFVKKNMLRLQVLDESWTLTW